MTDREKQQALLRLLPGVDRVLDRLRRDDALDDVPKSLLVRSIRAVLEERRSAILGSSPPVPEGEMAEDVICDAVKEVVEAAEIPRLRTVINATGIVVHTNLGRSLLADAAVENLNRIAGEHSNLEFDLSNGKRGSRYDSVADILCELSGAEAAMVVNNNAGAVLLCLETLAGGNSWRSVEPSESPM